MATWTLLIWNALVLRGQGEAETFDVGQPIQTIGEVNDGDNCFIDKRLVETHPALQLSGDEKLTPHTIYSKILLALTLERYLNNGSHHTEGIFRRRIGT